MKGTMSWPFLRLYLLTLLYFSANAILNVIIPLKGQSLAATNTVIGIVMGAYLFTTMLFRPWAGLLIQRFGPIPVLRAILVINGLALLLYPLAGWDGYVIARCLQGVCTAFFSMALQLGIIDALTDRERSQGISMYSLCASIPGIVGPLLAVEIWRSGDPLFFLGAMAAIAALTSIVGYSARMDKNESKANPDQARQAHAMLRSFGHLAKNPHLRKCSLLMLVSSLVFGAATAFIPLYALQVRGGDAATFLMLQAGTLVAARFFLRKKLPSDGRWHSAFIMGTMLLIALAAASVSLSVYGGALLFYAGAVGMGLAQSLLYPTLTTYLTFVLPSDSRNVLMGLFIAMADLGVSLSGAIMGPVADLSSYSFMYLICALLGVVLIAFAYERRQPSVRSGVET